MRSVSLRHLTYHPFILESPQAAEHQTADLGDKYLQLMHHHGILACGRTAAEAFWFHYSLEMACKIQVDILASGKEPILPTDTAVEAVGAEFDVEQAVLGDEGSPAKTRLLDKRYPDYKH